METIAVEAGRVGLAYLAFR